MKNSPPLQRLIRAAGRLDGTLMFFVALAAISGTACWIVNGPESVRESLIEDFYLLGFLLPKLSAAVLVAAIIPLLLSSALVARWLGENSGLKGVAIATAAGAVTPGGPMASFPLMSALDSADVGRQVLIAFITSWSVLAFQRILIWELPLMGHEFVVIRLLVSLPLPFIAAYIALALLKLKRRRDQGRV